MKKIRKRKNVEKAVQSKQRNYLEYKRVCSSNESDKQQS